MISLEEWMLYLKNASGAVGFPLVAGGLAMMLFGWRLWKTAVVLSYGLIGALLVAHLMGRYEDRWTYAVLAGTALGLLSYWPARHAIAVLGGLIGGGLLAYSLSNLGLVGPPLWLIGGVGFIGCAAYSFLSRQRIVVVVTAFFGAVLLMSGLTVWASAFPFVETSVHSLASGHAIVVPFIVLVPAVMSCFYQIAEVQRVDAEL